MYNEKIVTRMKCGAVHATVSALITESNEVSFRITLTHESDDCTDAWWDPLQFGVDDLPDIWKLAHDLLTMIHRFSPERIRALIQGDDDEQ